jgi:hypothetical protein
VSKGRRGGAKRRREVEETPRVVQVDGIPERFEDIVRAFRPLLDHPDVRAPVHPFADMRARWVAEHLLEHENKATVWLYVVRPGKLDFVRRQLEMRKNPDSAADFTCTFRDPTSRRAIKPHFVWPMRKAAHVHVRRLLAERVEQARKDVQRLLMTLDAVEALASATDSELTEAGASDDAVDEVRG